MRKSRKCLVRVFLAMYAEQIFSIFIQHIITMEIWDMRLLMESTHTVQTTYGCGHMLYDPMYITLSGSVF